MTTIGREVFNKPGFVTCEQLRDKWDYGTHHTPLEVVPLKLSGVRTKSSVDCTGSAAVASASEVTSNVCGKRRNREASLMV